MLPEGITAKVRKDSYPVPPIFTLMAKEGKVEERVMYNTYNMGLGMVLAVKPEDADAAVAALKQEGDEAFIVGETAAGKKEVILL